MADTTTKEIPSSGEGGGGVRTQTVVLLRHGVARHNFHGANLTSPSLLDPSLTVEGKVRWWVSVCLCQRNFPSHKFYSHCLLILLGAWSFSLFLLPQISAVSVGERIQHWWQRQTPQQDTGHVELVVCSPLSRTLQTASLAFLPDPEDPHPVPIVCIENVREAYGMHYPDKRRERSTLVVSACDRSVRLGSVIYVAYANDIVLDFFFVPCDGDGKSYRNNGRACSSTRTCRKRIRTGVPRNAKPGRTWPLAFKTF